MKVPLTMRVVARVIVHFFLPPQTNSDCHGQYVCFGHTRGLRALQAPWRILKLLSVCDELVKLCPDRLCIAFDVGFFTCIARCKRLEVFEQSRAETSGGLVNSCDRVLRCVNSSLYQILRLFGTPSTFPSHFRGRVVPCSEA